MAQTNRKPGGKKQDDGRKVVASNRKARHDYLIEDTYEAGMVLSGTEVKSLREGRASLVDGYAFIDGGEAWLDQVKRMAADPAKRVAHLRASAMLDMTPVPAPA